MFSRSAAFPWNRPIWPSAGIGCFALLLWAVYALQPVALHAAMGSPQAAAPVPQPTLLALTADAMDKTTLTLPAQLEGRQNLLLINWARDQQQQAESWQAVGQALVHLDPDTRVYTLYVNEPENALFRWWNNASLRETQTDPELLHSTLAVYTNGDKLRGTLGLPDAHNVAALLVDRSGRVLWKASGASTQESRAALLAAASRR